MAYVFSGDSNNVIEVNYTKMAMEGIIRNQKDKFTPYYFSFDDSDINYGLAYTANTNTSYTNVPLRGTLPTLTGIDSYNTEKQCLNPLALEDFNPNIQRGEIDNYLESCQPFFIPIQLDLSEWDENDSTVNVTKGALNRLGFSLFEGDLSSFTGGLVISSTAVNLSNIPLPQITPLNVTTSSSHVNIAEGFVQRLITLGYADSYYDLSNEILTLYINREDLQNAFALTDNNIIVVINENYSPSFINTSPWGNIGGNFNGSSSQGTLSTFAVTYQTLACRWDYTDLYKNFNI